MTKTINIPAAILLADFDPYEKLIFVYLWSFPDGARTPLKEINRKLRISRKKIATAMSKLETAGMVVRESEHIGRSQHRYVFIAQDESQWCANRPEVSEPPSKDQPLSMSDSNEKPLGVFQIAWL